MHRTTNTDLIKIDADNDDEEDARKERLPLSLAMTSFQCAFCEYAAADSDGIDAHVQEKHAPTDSPLYCESCALLFYTDVGLEAHRRREHGCR